MADKHDVRRRAGIKKRTNDTRIKNMAGIL